MNKEDYLKELQNELNNTDEFFLISKNKENYKLIHSNLSDCMEWLDMIEIFKEKLEDKIIDLKANHNAINDLLGDIGLNNN